MVPAQQRLDAGDLAARHVDLGLVVQRELVALQRAAQGALQRQALDRLRLDLLGEEAEAVLAVFLGEIHRHVGILGQRLHVGAVGRIHRDADRGRGVAFVAAQLQRLAEHGQQLAGDAFDLVAFGGLFQDDHEFVAAEPRHDVARAQRAAQPAADFHQQHVAGVMPQRIVDDLEAVEIDEQHGKLPLVALRGVDRAAQHLVEHFAVGQVGQAVMRRQIFDALVGLRLFVGAVEILQRERHVVGEPLQQLGEFRRERVLLGRHEDQDADHLPAREQRKRRAGSRSVLARLGVERLAARIGEIIVDDAGRSRAERRAARAASFGVRLVDRHPDRRVR